MTSCNTNNQWYASIHFNWLMPIIDHLYCTTSFFERHCKLLKLIIEIKFFYPNLVILFVGSKTFSTKLILIMWFQTWSVQTIQQIILIYIWVYFVYNHWGCFQCSSIFISLKILIFFRRSNCKPEWNQHQPEVWGLPGEFLPPGGPDQLGRDTKYQPGGEKPGANGPGMIICNCMLPKSVFQALVGLF